MVKQISLTIPDVLFDISKEYYESLGFRSLQEFIVDLIRRKVILENTERYKGIEERMKKSKKFSQKEAVNYLRSL